MRKAILCGTVATLAGGAVWACGDDGTEPAPVAAISVSPTSIQIAVGETQAITAVPQDASGNPLQGRTVTFTSQSQSVASVTAAGVVSGEGEGSTNIVVTSEGVSVQVPVAVTPAPVASVDVSPNPLELVVGETATLTVTLEDAQGNQLTDRTVTFESDDEAVATVDQDGEVTAQGEGETTVTATSEGQTGETTVIVTPVPVATIEVDPAELDLVVGQQQALTVTLRDAEGNELTERVVTFESDDEAVATVDEMGVVSAVGVGSATVTVTSEGQTAEVAVEVSAPPFEPAENTEVDGDRTFASVTIPVGVTVTITGDAVIHSLGEVNIAGSVIADCPEVQLISDGPVTVTGSVDTRCTTDPDAEGGQLRIVGTGAMTFTGSTVTSSGDLQVTNDSTLTLEDFQAAEALGVPVRPPVRALSGPCSYNGISSPNRPKPPTPETTGKTGANGTNARTKRFICDGDFDIEGGEWEGNDAGDGEDGTADAEDDSQGPAEGGDGGDAGELRILASGSITFRGGALIRLGNGGMGGNAARIAPPNRAAEAIGGMGGMSGTLTVQSGAGIDIPQPGGLTIDIGRPGKGGDADAVGGKGDDSTPTEPAKPGGNATATGGKGGSTPEARFRTSGNVSGIGNIVLTGGPAGVGGKATALGGQGGHGVADENPDGAGGGAQTATGGMGGGAPAGDFLGNPFVRAGDGGDAELGEGVGGDGLKKCLPFEPGGDGGMGGDGNAHGGDAGFPGEPPPASPGEAILRQGAGKGGDAGDGVPPGMPGGPGGVTAEDGMNPPAGAAPVEDNDPNYEPGAMGRTCIMVEGTPVVGEHTVGVTECDQQIGTLVLTNPFAAGVAMSLSFSPGNSFIYTMPVGVGLAPGASTEVGVYFNCQTTTSFETILHILGGTSTGIELIDPEIPVEMNIIQMEQNRRP